jgi:hypothetical protein
VVRRDGSWGSRPAAPDQLAEQRISVELTEPAAFEPVPM